MHHTLKHLAHATPTWLANLRLSDIEQGPGPWMKHLVKDAMAYPGAGLDGSPVRQCNGVIHSFIYLDYGTPKIEVALELKRQWKSGTGFAGHRLVGLTEYDPSELILKADHTFVHHSTEAHQAASPFGLWAIYESNDHGLSERFSLLYLGTEAVQALAALFPTSAPRGLVVQEHGFSGNCWPNFSEPILRISEKWHDLPEILILGPNHRLDQWRRNALFKGSDHSTESMHRDTREVLWLDSKAIHYEDPAHANPGLL